MEYPFLDAGRIRRVSRVRANVSAGSWEKAGESATEKEKESGKKIEAKGMRGRAGTWTLSLSACRDACTRSRCLRATVCVRESGTRSSKLLLSRESRGMQQLLSCYGFARAARNFVSSYWWWL